MSTTRLRIQHDDTCLRGGLLEANTRGLTHLRANEVQPQTAPKMATGLAGKIIAHFARNSQIVQIFSPARIHNLRHLPHSLSGEQKQGKDVRHKGGEAEPCGAKEEGLRGKDTGI